MLNQLGGGRHSKIQNFFRAISKIFSEYISKKKSPKFFPYIFNNYPKKFFPYITPIISPITPYTTMSKRITKAMKLDIRELVADKFFNVYKRMYKASLGTITCDEDFLYRTRDVDKEELQRRISFIDLDYIAEYAHSIFAYLHGLDPNDEGMYYYFEVATEDIIRHFYNLVDIREKLLEFFIYDRIR